MSKLPRFYVEPNCIKTRKFFIEDKNQIQKIRNVLRLREGDQVEIFDGKGNEYSGSLFSVRKDHIEGVLIEEIKSESIAKPYVILAQALPRAGKIDDIIKMNTEVGVDEFYFFESEYSVAKLDSLGTNKMERWQKVALEATRQSERNIAPIIHEPMSFSDALMIDAESKVILHSRDTDGSIQAKDFLKDLTNESKVCVYIGPEGGFSPKEIKLAGVNKLKIVHLNTPVLRTETAGIVISSLIVNG